jgi:Na+/melibiose symporter-like transporter
MIGAFYGRKIGKIFYSLGALGESLFFAIVATYLTYFYIEIARVDPVLVGLGYTLTYGIWNSINDIIAGYISDKTKTRWGRRIFYILFFTPLLMALFILIWTPPISQSSLSAYSTFLYFLLIVFFFEFVYTFVDLSWNSLFPEMYEEIQERSEIAVYRQVFRGFWSHSYICFSTSAYLVTNFISRGRCRMGIFWLHDKCYRGWGFSSFPSRKPRKIYRGKRKRNTDKGLLRNHIY